MLNLTSSQWHMIAAADGIIKCGGQIVGVLLDDVEHWFQVTEPTRSSACLLIPHGKHDHETDPHSP